MGGASSCACKRNKARLKQPTSPRFAVNARSDLYKIIYDVNGFSLHDMALIGLTHGKENLLSDSAKKPKACGRISVLAPNELFTACGALPAGVSKAMIIPKEPTGNVRIVVVEELSVLVHNKHLQWDRLLKTKRKTREEKSRGKDKESSKVQSKRSKMSKAVSIRKVASTRQGKLSSKSAEENKSKTTSDEKEKKEKKEDNKEKKDDKRKKDSKGEGEAKKK